MSPSEERVLRLLQDARHALESERRRRTEPIAVVGMGCRFPGRVSTPAEFWRLLDAGIDATSEVPADRWDADALYDSDPMAPGKCYVKRGAFLDAIDGFEPWFFGISPREAVGMDPQQRLLLEVAWEALEDSGIPPDTLRGSSTGVWIGLSLDDYANRSIGSGDLSRIDPYNALGSARSLSAGRIAYVLDLNGPVMQVDAACASSLVTLHLACQSLRAGECDLALVGGVNIMSSAEATVALCKLQALARDGRCKTFDASADGYGRGEGCGIVVLRRLRDALGSGQRIHGVIRGTAINHDGRSNGLTAPNGAAQEAVIRAALANAGLDARSVGYVEAHGTGTLLGDPIEVLALNRVYGPGRSRQAPLFLGSVKTNFGHLEGAAGVASLIKTILTLSHGRFAPHLHVRQLNPKISWRNIPVCVTTDAQEWPRRDGPRVAGVSAFGLSGTNAHVVVEEAPEEPVRAPVAARSWELVVVSAKTEGALRAAAGRLSRHVVSHPEMSLGDVAYSLATTRSAMEQRVAVVVPSREGLCRALDGVARGETASGVWVGPTGESRGKLAWVFTGQGAQRVGMGRELYQQWPAFRHALDAAWADVDEHLDRPLRSVMWAEAGTDDAEWLQQTVYTQPSLFAYGWALAALWRSWGMEPDLLAGHSVGEMTAACVAGVFGLKDGARLVCARGRLMQSLAEAGAMVSVEANERDVAKAIEGYGSRVSVAAVNGPLSVVISGEESAVTSAAEGFEGRGVRVTRLRVSHAFHSSLMDPMLEPFGAIAETVSYRAGTTAVVSNVSGMVSDPEMATSDYWVRHARAPVAFRRGVETLHSEGCGTFLELGPRATLLPLVAACLPEQTPILLASARSGEPETEAVLNALGGWVSQGGTVDWKGVFPAGGRRVDLPTYPWQRERYWIERRPQAERSEGIATGHPLLGVRVPSVGIDAIYESVWSIDQLPWLRGYAIDGRLLVPEATLVELVRAAVDDCRGDTAANIGGIRIDGPLVLAEGAPRHVQVAVSEDSKRVSIFSRPIGEGRGAWMECAVASVDALLPRTPVRLDLTEIRRRCVEPVDVAGTDRSTAHDPRGDVSLRALKRLWIGPDEALGEIDLSDAVDVHGYGIHPAILDVAIRAAAFAFASPVAPTMRVAEFKGVEIHQTGATAAIAYARLCQPRSTHEILATLTLADSTGSPIAFIGEMRLRPVGLEGVSQARSNRATDVFYRIAWHPTVLSENDASVKGSDRWAIVDLGPPEQSETLAVELSRLGARCKVVGIDDLGGGEFEHVVCFWDAGRDIDAVLRIADEGQAVVSAIERRMGAPLPRLWWATRAAVAVVPGQEVHPEVSTIWGLGRTVMQERPALRCTLLDVGHEPSLARILAREVSVGGDENEIAWLRGRRHVARLMRTRVDRSGLPQSFAPLRTDGTVLIVGGLTALGLEIAHGLVRRGIRHLLVVASPGFHTPRASESVAQLAARGAHVTVSAVDVTDRAALSRLLSAIPSDVPLRGVIYPALFDDEPSSEASDEPLGRELEIRVRSAWNLHQLTQTSGADWFVLVSSLGGTFGAPGRPGRAASDAFFDALAAHRRGRGLAGSSLIWGPRTSPLEDMHAAPHSRAPPDQDGIGTLTRAEGQRLLEATLGHSDGQLIVAAIDSTRLASGFGATVPPLWRSLVRPVAVRGPHTRTWGEEISGLADDDRLIAVTKVVREEMARALSLRNPGALPLDVPLGDLGFDSLMALELRSAFARRTGVSVPATLVLRETSARATAECILQLAAGATEPAVQRTSAPVARCETLKQMPRAQSRLFCFHDAGGSPAMFVPFGRLATDGVEVHAMSHTREGPPSAARGAQYIREAVSHILGASSRAPFALFGHSLGALLAWRLALELQALGGARPKLLIVSGSLSPEDWSGSSLSKDIDLAFRLVFGVSGDGSQNLRRDFEADLTLSRAIPARAIAPLDIPIHAFRGSDDPVVSEAEMRRWARCTTRAFSLTALPGTHSYLGEEGPRDVLLSELASRLADESLGHGLAEGAPGGGRER